jgi:hypothetical protein
MAPWHASRKRWRLDTLSASDAALTRFQQARRLDKAAGFLHIA